MNLGYFDSPASFLNGSYLCRYCELPIFDGESIDSMYFQHRQHCLENQELDLLSSDPVHVYVPLGNIMVQIGQTCPFAVVSDETMHLDLNEPVLQFSFDNLQDDSDSFVSDFSNVICMFLYIFRRSVILSYNF